MRHFTTKLRWVSYIFLAFLLLFIIFFLQESVHFIDFLGNPEEVKELVLRFGFWGPLAVVALQVLQALLSVFPSQIVPIAAGFVFGPRLGLLYSLLGALLGSSLVFYISRRYGDGLALTFFDKRELAHFHQFFDQRGIGALLFARLTPLFPNDVISFAAGVTKLSYLKFIAVSAAGYLLQMIVLTHFGAELAKGELNVILIIAAVIMTGLFLIALFKKQIKAILIKDFHKLEKKLEKINLVV